MFGRSRPAPFAVSLLVHGTILGWVASGPVREKAKSLYKQTIAPNQSKLVWYDFRTKLPEVSPAAAKPSSGPRRAEVKSPSQEIVAHTANAPHAPQLVWQPAPKLQLQTELQSPNVLAIHVERPKPPAKPKLFMPPPKVPAPTGEAAALAAPPEIRMAHNANGDMKAPGSQAVRPPPRKFVAPGSGRAAPKPAALPEVPTVSASANPAAAPHILNSGQLKAQPREFAAPHAGAKANPALTAPEAPPELDASMNPSVNMAIVGLKPNPSAPPPRPEGTRTAEFSAGPKPRETGGTEGKVDDAILSVPGLFVRSETPEKPALMARVAPTSAASLRAALHSGLPTAARGEEAAVSPQGAVRVSAPPDPLWHGRDAYLMAVQMPNVTSYTGSWMIWFAERDSGTRGSLTLPVPMHKVDPKYYPSAMADRVEGNVRLIAVIRRDGSVASVQLLQALDERLDQSAQEALYQWRFEPATRDGAPVEMDALIEIPFRLAPKVGK